jgi:hypothetical protein
VHGGSTTGFRSYSTGFACVDIESTRTSGNIGGIRWEKSGDSHKTAEINAVVAGGLSFKTGTGSSAIETRMTINSDGNVGIGTASPVSVFHTKQANATILVQDTDTAFSTTESYIKFSGSDANGNFRSDIEKSIGLKDNSLVFEHVGSETMRIDSSGNVGIGTTAPNAPLEILFNETNPNNDFSFAQKIDANFSGADNTTSDREQGGLWLDIDSSADGDLSDEHRLYGIYNDVRFTGFTDMVQAARIYVESNNSSETVTTVYGVNGVAVTDSNANGGIGTMIASRGQASVQDAGSVGTAIGVEGRVDITSSRTTDVGTTSAVKGEIQIDAYTAITYGDAIVFDAVFDNNEGSTNTNTNSYLFKGDYQGTRNATNVWGIYVEGDKHYLQGNLGINVTDPDAQLEIVNSSGGSYRLGYGGGTDSYFDSENFYVRSGNGGSNKLVVNSSGRVGIGTTNPSRELDVVGVIQAQGNFKSLVSSSSTNLGTSNGGNVTLTNSSATDGNFNNIGGYNSNSLVTSQINFINVSQAGRTGDISFNTHNGSDLLERMRIDSSGIVTGTITDDSFSDVDQLILKRIWSTGSSGDRSHGIALKDANSTMARIYADRVNSGTNYKSDLVFITNTGATGTDTSEKMRIDSSGNVGIGTTSPGGKLDIKTPMGTSGRFDGAQLRLESTNTVDTTGFQGIRFATSTTPNYGWSMGANRSGSGRGSFRFFEHINSITGVERFTIKQDGNVGIGTTNPAYKLDISGSLRATTGIFLGNISTSGSVLFNDNQGINFGNSNAKIYGSSTDGIKFNGGGSEKMRLTQAGNVGIGTTNPGVALDVVGAIRATGDVTAFHSSDERLKANKKIIENATDKIEQIGGYEFDWVPKEGVHINEGHDIGVIAQEVEKVIPEVVVTRDNGYKAVKYEKLVPLLIEAVKELSEKVKILENK